MKWRVSAAVSGGKYMGEFEADTGEEAVQKAYAKGGVHLCHQCDSQCENAEVHSFVAEAEDGTTYEEEPEISWEERARAAGWKPPRKSRR